MHTEAEIRKAIRPLLDKYGKLNTTEVKRRLDEVLVYDEDDLRQSSTRNEILITQRIGNIVAHQTQRVASYEEGFIVDKTTTPANFIAIKGINDNIQALSDEEIEVIKRRTQRLFKGKRIDWGKTRERNEEIGNLGEEFVMEYEKEFVSDFAPHDVGRVLHLSQLQGDGLGYDISSITEDGRVKKIEVKTTKNGENTPFYMSENEKLFFETYKDDAVFLYRVYDFDTKTRRGKIKIITAQELLENYNFDPITFAVTKK